MKLKNLDQLKIPYKIEYSDAIVDNLMRIAECRPFFLEHLSRPLKVQLIRLAKVRANTYSNQIEGNTLSEEEVAKAIKSKKRLMKNNEVLEVQNYSDALNYSQKLLESSRAITKKDFYDIQKLITSNLISKGQSGRPRTIPVSIANAETGEIIDTCPDVVHLSGAMDDLWDWLEMTKDANPFLRSFAFHFIAVAIHPFADGNGRSCRLMQHFLLLKSGEEIANFVPSETAIMNNRSEYYSSIRQSKKLNSLVPILEFLSMCFAESAEEVTALGKKEIRSRAETPIMRKDKILKMAQRKKLIKMADVIEIIPKVSRRTLERDLEGLCKSKNLKRKGDKKGRTYSFVKL